MVSLSAKPLPDPSFCDAKIVTKVVLSEGIIDLVNFDAPTQAEPLNTAISSSTESGKSSKVADTTLIFIWFKPFNPCQTVIKCEGIISPCLIITLATTGITELEATEATELPTELVALTVNV